MKTVSLELSKQLKEAGYPQESYFLWKKYRLNGEIKWKLTNEYPDDMYPADAIFASPTADEVLEKLPSEIQKDGHFYSIAISKTRINHFWVDYRYFSRHKIFHLRDYEYSPIESLANAAAKIWLYLKEKGFITE